MADAVTAAAGGAAGGAGAGSGAASVTSSTVSGGGKVVIPRGLPVSSRSWKAVEKSRSSAMTRVLHKTASGVAFRVQKAAKAARQEAREVARRLQEARTAEMKERRAKTEAKRKRRAENELKSSSYQVITDPSKLKRMNKKQLKSVKRMRVDERGVPEFVPAYSK